MIGTYQLRISFEGQLGVCLLQLHGAGGSPLTIIDAL